MPIYKVKGSKNKDGLQKYNVRVNYISDDGTAKQLTRTAYGSEAAKDLERRLTQEVKSADEAPAKRMTVQQLFDEYVVAAQYEIRESTLDKSKRNYVLYVQPYLANTRIDRLTVPLLQQWKLSIEQKGLSFATKKVAYSLLRKILNYGVRMEHLPKNLLLKVGNFKDAMHSKPEMDYYTSQEFTQYISTAKRLAEERQTQNRDLSGWDFYVFFAIAFYTGLRKGEILALKHSDINGAYLSIKRSITQKLKGEDRETPPKNKSSIRTLQLPLPLMQILCDHRARQERLEHFTDDFRICGGVRSVRDGTLSNRNVQYAKQSGLKVIRIHDFRHSHVSLLANAGINIQEIARRLGHSRVEETWNTYSHLYPREEERAVDILNAIA
jgi:integrase